jgi:uronate dehydrogenase
LSTGIEARDHGAHPVTEDQMPRFNRLLITGAAGNLGRVLREGLAPLAATRRLSDRAEMAPAGAGEEVVRCELGDFDAVMQVVEDCDAVVHFGAAPVERPWAEILDSSIKGGYNVYEAARRHGIRRVVYASSIHAVGYARREEGADTDTPHKPDSLYGLSKCFVEDLAFLYHRKFGIESALLRINSCFPEPADRRHLATWMSFRDLVQLVERCLCAERIGCTVVYGISDNRERFFSNEKVAHLGYRPQDSAEPHRARVEAACPPGDPFDPAVMYAGGVFCAYGHPDDSEG